MTTMIRSKRKAPIQGDQSSISERALIESVTDILDDFGVEGPPLLVKCSGCNRILGDIRLDVDRTHGDEPFLRFITEGVMDGGRIGFVPGQGITTRPRPHVAIDHSGGQERFGPETTDREWTDAVSRLTWTCAASCGRNHVYTRPTLLKRYAAAARAGSETLWLGE